MEQLVCADEAGFVDAAVRLGGDAQERQALRESILANRGALFERDEPVRAFEEFLASAASGAP
jgi:predicted O-linked N-acetylglucosamine transferase (SPINDLY family)